MFWHISSGLGWGASGAIRWPKLISTAVHWTVELTSSHFSPWSVSYVAYFGQQGYSQKIRTHHLHAQANFLKSLLVCMFACLFVTEKIPKEISTQCCLFESLQHFTSNNIFLPSSSREKWWQESSGFVHLLWCANHPFLNRDTAPNPILVGGQHQTRKNQYDEFSHHVWILGNTLFIRCPVGLYKSHLFRLPFTLLWFLRIGYFLYSQCL